MAYTSGRSVKSAAKRVSPIQAATAEGRKLARRHLPATSVMVDSAYVAGLDGVTRIKTSISFSERSHDATKPLAAAVAELNGYHSMAWNLCSITYLRAI